VKPKLAPAVAGRSFTVPMVVTDAKTKKGVRGKLTCQAKLNGKTFRASRQATAASGRATCTWKLPSTSSNEILRGTITETYKGATAKRTFSTRIL
jgi:hypothetical protein